jgi:hypothetical protein
MLYSNNPAAYEAIIEGCRRDNGQHVVGVGDDARSTPTQPLAATAR